MAPVLIVLSLLVLATPASAQDIIKTCAGVEVRSMDVSHRSHLYNLPIDTKPGIIETSASSAEAKVITVVALGPILGSMDGLRPATDLTCTKDGVAITATITRSAYYKGWALQNVLWQPMITLKVRLDSPRVFESIWKMELSDGKKIDRTQMFPYPEQQYPIVVTKTLRSTSDHK